MKAIMVVGTTSHAGKSLVATALCRILSRRGWRIAPFKGQNTASNSYVTNAGAEIGYAQAVQAWAAKVPPVAEMNPILLKPQSDLTAKVVLRGRSIGRIADKDYPEKFFDTGWQTIQESLKRLEQEFDFLVCEGDGSPVEIDFKQRDLANMRIARHLNAPTVLVADVERGGVFAHIVGTLELLEPEERALVKGIIINKFQGPQDRLQPGIEWLQERTGVPVIGVLPMLNQAFPSEDSLSLLERSPKDSAAALNIAVIRLPHISNFTDFDPLESEESVRVRYVNPNDDLGYPDAVILPGTKSTIADIVALQRSGMAEAIRSYMQAGGTVLGICGGFQMMGEYLADPEGIEGQDGRYKGLQLVPIRTVITTRKIARQRDTSSQYPQVGLPISGYELHQGRTQLVSSEDSPVGTAKFDFLFEDKSLGIVDSRQALWGTYLHGLFDNGPWRRSWLNCLRQQRGLSSLPTGVANFREQREMMLDGLADAVEGYLNLDPLLKS